MKYQVGILDFIREDDPEFDTKEAAFEHAYTVSNDRYEETFGIWTGQDDGSELIAIAHNGDIFRRDFADFGITISLPFLLKDEGVGDSTSQDEPTLVKEFLCECIRPKFDGLTCRTCGGLMF